MQTVLFNDVWTELVIGHLNKASLSNVPAQLQSLMASAVNRRFREGWNLGFWPDALVAEERAFRVQWSSTLAVTQGLEVYHAAGDTYYEAVQASLNVEPPNTDYWTEVSGLATYLLHEPSDNYPLGTVYEITKEDPERYPDRLYSYTFQVRSRGVWVSGTGLGTKVWVTHKPRAAKFTRTEFDEDNPPVEGGVIYNPTDGECYQAVLAGGVEAWTLMQFPAWLQGFVVKAAYADALTEDGQKERAAAQLGEAYRLLQYEWDVQEHQQAGNG